MKIKHYIIIFVVSLISFTGFSQCLENYEYFYFSNYNVYQAVHGRVESTRKTNCVYYFNSTFIGAKKDLTRYFKEQLKERGYKIITTDGFNRLHKGENYWWYSDVVYTFPRGTTNSF